MYPQSINRLHVVVNGLMFAVDWLHVVVNGLMFAVDWLHVVVNGSMFAVDWLHVRQRYLLCRHGVKERKLLPHVQVQSCRSSAVV